MYLASQMGWGQFISTGQIIQAFLLSCLWKKENING